MYSVFTSLPVSASVCCLCDALDLDYIRELILSSQRGVKAAASALPLLKKSNDLYQFLQVRSEYILVTQQKGDNELCQFS